MSKVYVGLRLDRRTVDSGTALVGGWEFDL